MRPARVAARLLLTLLTGLVLVPACAWAAGEAAPAPQATPPTHRVPDTLAQRVKACEACHGREGQSTRQGYVPRIAGKPAHYLYSQLMHFREGRRTNAVMTAWVDPLTPAYLQEIAQHFADVDLPYAPPARATPSRPGSDGHSAPATTDAAALIRQGDRARDLPACTHCHGENLMGRLPATPGLLGLPQAYVAAQINAWRLGHRRAAQPDCMGQVARALKPEDIQAVAAWLAAQPVPTGADAKPAAARAANDAPLCGLVPLATR